VFCRSTSYPDAFVDNYTAQSIHPTVFASHRLNPKSACGKLFDKTPVKSFYEIAHKYHSPVATSLWFLCAGCR